MKATKKNSRKAPVAPGTGDPSPSALGQPPHKASKAGAVEAAATKRKEAAGGKNGSTRKDRAEPAPERVKLVRDSFTMPREDFDLVAMLKARALEFRRPTKKSELLRAGLQMLAAQDDRVLRAALEALRPLKAGRPSKKR